MGKKGSVGRALTKRPNPPKASSKSSGIVSGTDNTFPTRSITEENSLSEFFNIAKLANADFTAQKKTFRIVSKDEVSGVPSPISQTKCASIQKAYVDLLKIPKRPPWNQSMSAADLTKLENEEFLKWRRALADLEATENVILTPFEKNIEFWRQLWRVVERSDILVQIVDARQPLLYYCPDLDRYAHQIDSNKICVVLANKADFLTHKQRCIWRNYLESKSIRVIFWSATESLASGSDNCVTQPADSSDQPSRDPSDSEDVDSDSTLVDKDNVPVQRDTRSNDEVKHAVECSINEERGSTAKSECGGQYFDCDASAQEDGEHIRLLSSNELLDFLTGLYPQDRPRLHQSHLTIGFVGYPNVGKSSTLNALLGAKKTAVSTTPGRTKHFQTFHVRPDLVLCDCPGLVMPSFAHSRADLVVAGILSVDELPDFLTPIGLICQQIPRSVLEFKYRIDLSKPRLDGRNVEDKPPTPYELLAAHALSRSFMATKGNPHYDRSARIILKDYVQGRLLYCHPPPDVDPVHYQSLGYNQTVVRGRSTRIDSRKQPSSEQPENKAQKSNLIDEFDKLAFTKENTSLRPHLRTRKMLLRPPSGTGDVPAGDDDDAASTSTWTTIDSSLGTASWAASSNVDAKRPWRLMSLSKRADLASSAKPGRTHNRREKLRRVYRHLDQHEIT